MSTRDDIEMIIKVPIGELTNSLRGAGIHPQTFYNIERAVALGYSLSYSSKNKRFSVALGEDVIRDILLSFHHERPKYVFIMRQALQLGYMSGRAEYLNSTHIPEFREERFENPLPRIVNELRRFRKEKDSLRLFDNVAWSY